MSAPTSGPFAAAAPQAGGPVPLNKPLYGASFGQASKRYWKKYAAFKGRASRSEYWWAQLMVFLLVMIPTALVVLFSILGGISAANNAHSTVIGQDTNGNDVVVTTTDGVISTPYFWPLIIALLLLFLIVLATVIPSLSLSWRRMQDAGFPGAIALLSLVFLAIIPFVIAFFPSKPGGERFDTP